jgi:hypothetical protein
VESGGGPEALELTELLLPWDELGPSIEHGLVAPANETKLLQGWPKFWANFTWL